MRTVAFIAVFALLSLPTTLPWAQPPLDAFGCWSAGVAAAGLHLVGVPVRLCGAALIAPGSPDRSVVVAAECSGVSIAALYVAALLAWPAKLRHKLAGLVVGLGALLAINLLRIATLYWIRVYQPQWFDTAHEEAGTAVFMGATACLILVWASWASRCDPRHATA